MLRGGDRVRGALRELRGELDYRVHTPGLWQQSVGDEPHRGRAEEHSNYSQQAYPGLPRARCALIAHEAAFSAARVRATKASAFMYPTTRYAARSRPSVP